ncbi:response regulator transcription factor [Mycolicibacterium wolinskyi]|uniref:LuxR family transcriptional regulator n=1 Tax=Mycolicibacterium wolinskyi TaxID=59750 RepID=A0A1X2F1K6_9MYCO|nr:MULTISPECIES: response regulator transcription factor [Mycolicibacterium]MCV7287931.1 response regulator transcription factor [Mycolicibacterium wolinskyi]MCV7294829.1 response regulator transcription factor [Mycolicibacterium goodii]ORX12323.1 LuxR family transcriptional regulator [Mycolicibacterium wolinskyi]
MTRLAIAEDNAILRDGLTQLLLERGHDVVAKVGTAEELRDIADTLSPEVFVIDIRMPPTYTDEGLVAAVSLRRTHPHIGVLLFSQWVETRYAAELLAGRPEGVGYLLKDRVADIGEFDSAVRRVAAGGTALDPEVVRQLMGARRGVDVLDRLTAREREVLALMAEGHSNSGLADKLSISERAVEKHVTSIFAKLNLPPSQAHHRRVLAVVTYLNS